jgi:PIN domain nuclease of toxin-antitoxin system
LRLLLDTHALLWFLSGDDQNLAPAAREKIADPANDVFASTVSFWEIAVKLRIGKLEANLEKVIAGTSASGFRTLGIEPSHIVGLMGLPFFPDHRDPFDHLLIAQAKIEALTFVSRDSFAPRYDVALLRCDGQGDEPGPPGPQSKP